MELIFLINNRTMNSSSPRNICVGGHCPDDVLKQSLSENLAENGSVLHLFLDVIKPAIIPAILTIICCHLWTCYVTGTRDVTCSLPLPPGGFGLPLIGETLSLVLVKKYFQNRREKHGNIYKTHLFGKPTIRVIGAENVKQILRGENTLVAARWPTSACVLLGEGCISVTSGPGHMEKKRTLMRAFTFQALSGYIPVIQDLTRAYIRRWCKEKQVLGFPELKLLNFEIFFKLLTGSDVGKQDGKQFLHVFENFITNIFSVPVDMPGFGFRKGLKARSELLQKIDDAILEKQSGVNQTANNILSIIMKGSQNGDNMSKTHLKNICLELLFAGNETTSSSASFLLLQLAKNPEVILKIKQEIAAVGLNASRDETDIDLQLLNKMTYVNNVVKEALRLSPPIGGGFRKALKTFEINGYQIPKDWAVTYAIRDTHETGGYFPDSDKFNPDRWNNSSTSESRFQYLPFGGGRRTCAGKELAQLILKIVTIELVRGCEWELINKNTQFKVFPMPCPDDNLPVVFKSLHETK